MSALHPPGPADDVEASAGTAEEGRPDDLWAAAGVGAAAPAATGSLFRDLAAIAGRARPLRRAVGRYLGLYALASGLLLLSLAAFHLGFTVVTGDVADPGSDPVLRGLLALGVPADRLWLPLFSGFVATAVLAAYLDHRGWVRRLELLADYEQRQMLAALRAIARLDPRERARLSRRELLLAARGDCKAMRLVFQLTLLCAVSLLQAAGPIAYVATIDPALTGLTLAVLAAAFVPIGFLARASSGMSFERQNRSLALGARVSRLLKTLQRHQLEAEPRARAVAGVRQALEGQHELWRRQYEIRSLAQKLPQVFSLLAVFAVLLWGLARIESGVLSWGGLLTFVVAVRMVFGPIGGLGNRIAKAAEMLPRARRHLAFMRTVAPQVSDDDRKAALRWPAKPSLTLAGVPLPGPDGPVPVDLTLGPGAVLTIVDPAADALNPLFSLLQGERHTDAGSVLLAEQPLAELRHASLLEAYASHGEGGGHPDGPLRACLRAVAGSDATDAEVEAFAADCLGPELAASLPLGLDTHVSRPLKKARRIPRSSWRLLQLFRLHHKRRLVVVADMTGPLHPHCRVMIRRYTERLRGDAITLWLDRAPRFDLPDQTIAVFERGRFRGLGDLAWFQRTFPDWPRPADEDADAVPAPAGA